MGVAQSALHGQAALVSLNGQKSCHKLLQGDVQVEESGRGSPDVFMIEPVPEGLEHVSYRSCNTCFPNSCLQVVYPKYEEAFRLGLKAFNNPMRVNKFARPLPHILGSDASRRDSNAGKKRLLCVRRLLVRHYPCGKALRKFRNSDYVAFDAFWRTPSFDDGGLSECSWKCESSPET